MPRELALTVCAVTIDRPRIEAFLQHHLPIAQDSRLEWLIFCPTDDRSALEGDWSGSYAQLKFFADDGLVGLNERRNHLLHAASGQAVIFLDDDSYIAHPETALDPLLGAAAIHPWVLLSRSYWGQEDRQVPPKSFRLGEVGSGIEWNQLFRVSELRAVGGWDPLFGPGMAWCSGEAFVLMFTLARAGYRQHEVPEGAISHPAQSVRRDLSNLGKFRSYRKAMGTMLLYLCPRMSRWEFATWLLRMTLGPLPGAVLALLKGNLPLAALRVCTPFDILEGMRAFRRSPREATPAPATTKLPQT